MFRYFLILVVLLIAVSCTTTATIVHEPVNVVDKVYYISDGDTTFYKNIEYTRQDIDTVNVSGAKAAGWVAGGVAMWMLMSGLR